MRKKGCFGSGYSATVVLNSWDRMNFYFTDGYDLSILKNVVNINNDFFMQLYL